MWDDAGRIYVAVTTAPLEIQRITQEVIDPSAGAISTFVGTTRNNFAGKTVLKLEYEGYKPMAIKTLRVRASEQSNVIKLASNSCFCTTSNGQCRGGKFAWVLSNSVSGLHAGCIIMHVGYLRRRPRQMGCCQDSSSASLGYCYGHRSKRCNRGLVPSPQRCNRSLPLGYRRNKSPCTNMEERIF
jgi:hypothetical protein